MKIQHAHWERRNLGLNVYEIVFEHGDTDQFDVDSILPQDAEYICVKVPTAAVPVMKRLHQFGFQFIETQSQMSISHLPPYTSLQSRILKSVVTRASTKDDVAEIYSRIEGGLFTADRVSLDDEFTSEQAASRYKGWIDDTVSSDGSLQSIIFKSELVGFFLIQDLGNGLYASLLAGVFSDVAPLGIGSLINHLGYQHCFDLGAKEVLTAFSSNNWNAAAIHASLPLKLVKQYHVYIKHMR